MAILNEASAISDKSLLSSEEDEAGLDATLQRIADSREDSVDPALAARVRRLSSYTRCGFAVPNGRGRSPALSRCGDVHCG